jgi:hypothetical protein
MTRRRPPRPGYKSAPEYVLQVIGNTMANGQYFMALVFPNSIQTTPSKDLALRMRGAGLASSERAINRRGYIVERVPA